MLSHTHTHTHTQIPTFLLFPFLTLLVFFLTLIQALCGSPGTRVTMTQSLTRRFVTILRSNRCRPMGSGLEVDTHLGIFRISGPVPCPQVSPSRIRPLSSSVLKVFFFLFNCIAPPTCLTVWNIQRKYKVNNINQPKAQLCSSLVSP